MWKPLLLLFAFGIPSHCGLTTLHLSNGTQLQGELVTSFNQSLWWNSAAETTYILFQPQYFATYPNDKSLVVRTTPEVAAAHAPSFTELHGYRIFMRARGFTIQQPPLLGVFQAFTHNDTYHLEENGYGDYAWDLMRTDSTGARFANDGSQNDDYLVWDSPVYLPHAGTVVDVMRDQPDNTPGSYPSGAVNNMVGIHIEGSYYLYLLHFRQDTIPAHIVPGEFLPKGTYLGQVGNAGVTLEPHLHMTMFWWDTDSTPPRYWSIPSEFEKVHTRSALEPTSTFHPFVDPAAGTWISSSPF